MKKNKANFKWQPFSDKQLKVMTWWNNNSPMKDKDGIIADGAVRSGKTISMAPSFIMWAMEIIPDAFLQNINDIIAEIYNAGGQRLSLSIIMALILSSKAFISIQQGLNALYETKESRNFIMVRVFAVIYSFVFAMLLIIVLGFLVFGNRLSDRLFANVSIIEHLVEIRMMVLVPVLFFFFMILYYFVPNKKQKIRNQIPGAIFASMGWILFSLFFSLYVDKINKFESFYGAMTTMALLMLWLYGCMYVLFIGGLINRVLEIQE